MDVLVFLARILYGGSLLMLGLDNLTRPRQTASYAASKGVPSPELLVPISGILIVFGGLGIALGLWAKIGALMVIAFLLPVTPIMHDYWTLDDPQARQNQQIHFMKNLALLGGALLILYFGSGPLSLTEPAF